MISKSKHLYFCKQILNFLVVKLLLKVFVSVSPLSVCDGHRRANNAVTLGDNILNSYQILPPPPINRLLNKGVSIVVNGGGEVGKLLDYGHTKSHPSIFGTGVFGFPAGVC